MASVKRRMLRAVLIVVDASKASSVNDIKPNRLVAITNSLVYFSRAFFDENPLSSMGLLCTRKGKVERLCELTKSFKKMESALLGLQTNGSAQGSASLQNSLEWALSMFKYVPDYVEREVLIVASAMSVVDPGDVFLTIKQLKDRPTVRCSTIHMCGLVEVFKRLADQTGGTFGVPLNAKHLQELLTEHVTPPPSSKDTSFSHMVHMGFPSQKLDSGFSSNSTAQPAYCLDVKAVVRAPYYCPQCSNAVAIIPATCRTCGLNLISSSHLARSHHHIFPVPPFEDFIGAPGSVACFACKQGRPPNIAQQNVFFSKCTRCTHAFCRFCDDLIHDTLFVCPGCL